MRGRSLTIYRLDGLKDGRLSLPILKAMASYLFPSLEFEDLSMSMAA